MSRSMSSKGSVPLPPPDVLAGWFEREIEVKAPDIFLILLPTLPKLSVSFMFSDP
jgi:hypothetical protein